MRTAIFIGAMLIGEAILQSNNVEFKMSNDNVNFFGLILLIFMVMDIIEFYKKNFKSK